MDKFFRNLPFIVAAVVISFLWVASCPAYALGITPDSPHFGSNWSLVNVPPPTVDSKSSEYKVCKMLKGKFTEIYHLYRSNLPEAVTRNITVDQPDLHPILAYPLDIAVTVIYSFTPEQAAKLTESWWVSQSLVGCSKIIGPPLIDDHFYLPYYHYGTRETSLALN